MEIIFRAERLGLRVTRVPVTLVNDRQSTVSIRRHALEMLLDVLRVRWRALHGAYDGMRADILAFPTDSPPQSSREQPGSKAA